MKQESVKLINPFRFTLEPMERLLQINFEKDPDTFYIGFEPQYYDDSTYGRGHVILGWRTDGKIDVYHQPSIRIENKTYDTFGKGLNEKIECSFDVASFDIGQKGVQVLYRFTDKYGRKIKLKIHEKNFKKRSPFNLLAPVGASSQTPSYLPLVYLFDFYFVRKNHTVVDIHIGEQSHKLDNLPVTMDGMRMYFSRYSAKPLIVKFNPYSDEHMSVMSLNEREETVRTKDCTLELDWQESSPAIRTLRYPNHIYPVDLSFVPPFPDILTMEHNKVKEGIFQISCHPSLGLLIGRYRVIKRENSVKIKCCPIEGWSPIPEKWSLRFLYRREPVYREWPMSYEWKAFIDERSPMNFYMRSSWKRLKR